MKYRKKPVVIDAMQFNGDNEKQILDWICSFDSTERTYTVKNTPGIGIEIVIHTLEGDMTASKDDYIIRGVKGEFYPCKPDIFEQTYELVGE